MWDKTQGCEFFDGHYYQSKSDFLDGKLGADMWRQRLQAKVPGAER